MKKEIYIVTFLLILSFIFHINGIYAKVTTSMANFTVPAWSAGIYVDKLNKSVDSPERTVLKVYLNRDIKARIVATNSGLYNGDSDYYWTLKHSNNNSENYIGTDLYAAATAYAYFCGDKTLYFKTSGFWYDTTSVSGTWYVNG
ncbi:MAG: hypothetical protein RR359_03165 [Bacilli bacterium]